MSNSTTNATVNLTLNGQQALQTLNQLRNNALQLETAIAKAAATGKKTDLKKLRKELTDTRKQIREIESATQQVDTVLRRLNKATPQELNKSLQTLHRQLQYMERGSEVWNTQVAKIQAVKAELAKVNAELRVSETRMQRFNRILNDWQNTIMGGIAAFTGLTMAGRKAVNAYADMEEQLANTRKYTGMTEKDVLALNETFKAMDTRTPREKLNELAQEAGRLGKNTLESVQGYVEAADIINVALVDLGEGATQTIAKLTNIFGVDEALGTKDAMLSVGSAVNVLSQNCTASKSYLVEFAQRMAGIGAQADMTIPEILAFGATLDANGQKTEMSSSALGKLAMMLFRDTEKMAKSVGLDVMKFSETLNNNATQGIIMFLEQIQKLGSKDGLAVLAPMFKDMGVDGVRMSQVLSTLADHLDMVKWEIGEANKAFSEATSASNEYKIFNTTVQAGIDKARKSIAELSVQLGEKLLPVMRHVYTTSSMTLRLLNIIVTFITTYSKEIIVASSAFIAYKVAINAANIAFKAHYAWLVLTQTAHKVGAALLVTYRTAVLLCSQAYYRLTGNLSRATAAQRLMNTTAKANIYALLASAVVALATALWQYTKRLSATEQAEKAMEGIRKRAVENAQEETLRLNTLRNAAMNETLSLQERKKAIDELNKVVPGYNASLDSTTGKYTENKVALDKYIDSLVRMYEIEGAKDKLKEIGKRKADLNIKRSEAQKSVDQTQQDMDYQLSSMRDASGNTRPQTSGGSVAASSVHAQAALTAQLSAQKRVLKDINKELEDQAELERIITEQYGTEMQKAALSPTPATEEDTVPVISAEEGKANKDRFAAEKAWREREEALNRIAYATGQKNYEEYTTRMLEIASEFYKKELEHTDLTADERLSIEANYNEAVQKQKEERTKQTIAQEDLAYREAVAREKQRYADGLTTTKDYEEALHLLDLQHLQTTVLLLEAGTKERVAAEKAYQDALVADQKKRLEEAERLEQKHQEQLKKVKEATFGLNPAERQAAFDTELGFLQEVYDKEVLAAQGNRQELLRIEKAFLEAKLALQKKYNIDGAADIKNAMARAVGDSLEWLDSDGGKALTGSMDALVSGMSSIFTQLTSLIQAETEIQTAAIENRYDKQLSLAEGNAYMEAKLEKEKEEEIAAAKREANKKQFAMQVIQAIAQTAQGALAAYSSAAAIPLTGWILAPIAASMALAAGAIQIAAIKKQQQASEATGYASGGYTPKGDKYEEVGVVHAGEWVASQELLANPVASQMIEALDYAQRTNTIGSLRAEDVSRSITAPVRIAQSTQSGAEASHRVAEIGSTAGADNSSILSEYSDTMKQLKERLSEPFVTINTVEGDHGIKKAQEQYDILIRNKTPKSRR